MIIYAWVYLASNQVKFYSYVFCRFPFFRRILPPIELALKDCGEVQKVGLVNCKKRENFYSSQ